LPFIIISTELIRTQTKIPLCCGGVAGCRTGTGQEEEEKGGAFASPAEFGTFLTRPWTGDQLAAPGAGIPVPRPLEVHRDGLSPCRVCPLPCGALPVRQGAACLPLQLFGELPAQPLSCVPGKEDAPSPTCMPPDRDAGRALLAPPASCQ